MSDANLPILLIVDDEVRGLESLTRILQDHFDVKTASDIKSADQILQEEWVRIILCDQRMPETTGVEYLKQVREKWPDVIRMIISGYSDAEDIIAAVNDSGIYQYITKPWHPDNLILTLKNAVRAFELQRQNEILSLEMRVSPQYLERVLAKKAALLKKEFSCDDGIVRSKDSCMNAVCDKIQRVAPYDVSVLLTGDSGTGKELAARALHYNSHRGDKPFVVENCGALPDELLESELFGCKRGAYTGAVQDRVGLFERANGGTVFLDEIGEVSPAFQVKLLRVLQEGEIRPLGSGRTRYVDVRVIAATNRDLEADVRSGRFREDLYYRIATVEIDMPPIHQRKGDIPLLAEALLQQAVKSMGKSASGFSAEALACMQEYHWPGNVRELHNEIQHMLVMAEEEVLGAELLSARVLQGIPDQQQDSNIGSRNEGTLKERVGLIESRILKEALIRHRWNKTRVAKEMGLSRVGLRGKLERYGLAKIEGLPAKAAAGKPENTKRM